MIETPVIILAFTNALSILLNFFLAMRKQPIEAKTALATVDAIDVKTGSVYIDNQQRLLELFSKQSFEQMSVLNELSTQKIEIGRLTSENIQLKIDVNVVSLRATNYQTLYEKMKERVDGFPAQIEALQAEIQRRKNVNDHIESTEDAAMTLALDQKSSTNSPKT